MKRLGITLLVVGFVLCAGLFVALLRGAQERAMLEKPQLVGFAATPLYDDTGLLVSLHVTSTFRVLELLPDGRRQRWKIKTCEFDLIQEGGQVVLGNQRVEFADIGADIVGVSDFVWTMMHPTVAGPLPINPKNPPPVARKTLRGQ